MARFLDLPAELRNNIYDIVLIMEHALRFTDPELPPHTTAITAVNRQTRHETLPVFFGGNVSVVFGGSQDVLLLSVLCQLLIAVVSNVGSIFPEFGVDFKQRTVTALALLYRAPAWMEAHNGRTWKRIKSVIRQLGDGEDKLVVTAAVLLKLYRACLYN